MSDFDGGMFSGVTDSGNRFWPACLRILTHFFLTGHVNLLLDTGWDGNDQKRDGRRARGYISTAQSPSEGELIEVKSKPGMIFEAVRRRSSSKRSSRIPSGGVNAPRVSAQAF